MPTTVVNRRRQPNFDVYIGRPSKWGNPYVIGPDGTREQVIRRYKKWFLENEELREDAVVELKDQVLGCYCKPAACHGDVLAEWVNGECEAES